MTDQLQPERSCAQHLSGRILPDAGQNKECRRHYSQTKAVRARWTPLEELLLVM